MVSAPTRASDRIPSLDLLRGVALLGILVINIRYFAFPLFARDDPAFPDGTLATGDFWTWFFGTLFFEDKLIALFSILFGAGLVLTVERGLPLHLSRHAWLFVIGAVHAFLIWHGDVLMIYAVCGVLLTPLRRAPAWLLVALGLLAVTAAVASRQAPGLVHDLGPPLVAVHEPSPPTESALRSREAWGRLFAGERAAHEGSYAALFRWRAELNLWWHFHGGLFNLLRCGGFMLLGMALLRLRVLTDERGAAAAALCCVAGLLVGVPLTLVGMHPQLTELLGTETITEREALRRLASIGTALRHLAALPFVLFWIGAVLLAGRLTFLAPLWRALAAVGRTALSGYVLTSVACVLVFDGYGLGRFGKWSHGRALLLVVGVWAVLLIAARAWLGHFRFGPLEWLWRSATFFRLQPLRTSRPPDLR